MKLNIFPEENDILHDSSIYFMPYMVLTIIILCSMPLIVVLTFLAHKYYVREGGDKPHSNQFDVLSFFKIFIFIKEKLGIQRKEMIIPNDTQSISENFEHLSTTTTTDSTTSIATSSTTSFKTISTEPEFDSTASSTSSEKCTNVSLIDPIFYKKNLINILKDSFYTKIKNELCELYLSYHKYKILSLNKLKSTINKTTIRQSYLYSFLRSRYNVLLYFIVSNSNQWVIWLMQKGKRYTILRDKTEEEDKITEIGPEQVYQNDITKLFNDTFDHLINQSDDEEYQEITHKLMSCPSITTTSTISNSTSTSSSSTTSYVKLQKFHYDYHNKKIIFHPNSLYHEQNAKKYNTLDANIDGDKLYSSVTIILTTCNRKELSYFPRYPWYWDGVELFNGISVRTKPFYHPNFLSISWRPRKKDLIMSPPSPVITNIIDNAITTTSSISSSSSNESDNNKLNFTLALTRTNSF